jgi:hypothetical protein
MCRSIKVLRNGSVPATPDEIEAAALQFVRKVSGYRKPAAKNEAAFNAAVLEITKSAQKLLESITTPVAAR